MDVQIWFIQKMIRSYFKTFNQVQDQGGLRWATTGIVGLFRGLTTLIQHRDWA